jgi:hypothetical protein
MKHSIGLTIPAATTTTMFTVPEGYVAEMDLLYIHNKSVTNKTIDVYWQHAHDPTHQIYILDDKLLSSKDYLQFSDGTVVLQAGDALKVLTETDSDYTVIVTFDLRKEKPLYTFLNA